MTQRAADESQSIQTTSSWDLERAVKLAFAGVARKQVVVGFYDGTDTRFAAISDEMDEAAGFEWEFPVGCVSKLLTAALIGREAEAGRVALDAPVEPLLRPHDPYRRLAGVTVRMLLEHTHGLEAPECAPLARNADGRIDVPNMLSTLVRGRLGPPGALYSYSSVGAWLAAAVLERLNGCQFEEQLWARLLEPMGIVGSGARVLARCSSMRTCPATGAALALRGADLMKCLRAITRPWPPCAVQEVTPLPGWNPLERGVWRGWKYHGRGWFGHQSAAPGASVLVRVHPQRDLAIVVASRHHHAAVVAARIFGSLLPELTELRFPKRLPSAAAARLDTARYCGRYGSAGARLSVETRGGRALRLIGASFESDLVPATDNVFYAPRVGPGQLAFVQFLAPTQRGFRYLWDSRCALRREARADAVD